MTRKVPVATVADTLSSPTLRKTEEEAYQVWNYYNPLLKSAKVRSKGCIFFLVLD